MNLLQNYFLSEESLVFFVKFFILENIACTISQTWALTSPVPVQNLISGLIVTRKLIKLAGAGPDQEALKVAEVKAANTSWGQG